MAYAMLLSLLVAQGDDVQATNHRQLRRNAMRYFEVWNSHDVAGLRSLLAAEATLRDWEVEKKGGDEVAAANAKIFAAAPGIKIEVLMVHVAVATRTAACEILVRLNNDKADVLKVVDIIGFDEQGKIVSVRAYKG
eukprot:CAMPEP_0119072020 /NCGR_PEP_ID=MMETSP1178-20130426/56650_1 /TAXON_ID=33656 /ORGANISM="unid sp, Strain CCMP2000" /LENGTH=135 /DNA_ID=CAMNT_0007054001 /DNA_START=29 /DNA_END=436 /DNA_ORIENTATION=+